MAHVRQRKRTKLQKQVWMFLEDPDLIRGGRIYENVLSCVILASAWLPVIPKQFLGVNDTTVFGLDLALFSVDCLFFLEVTLRFYGCPNRLRFFTSFYNALDILSVILPMAMKLRVQSLSLAAEDNLDMSGIELLLIVLVPVVRLLKLLRRFENSHLIQQAFSEALGALPSLLYCMMLLVFFFSSVIYVLESESGNIESMPRAIWFTMVTLSTVGYGDIVPKSSGGNMVVCVLIVVSAMYMAMPIGIVGKAFGSVWDDRHRLLLMQRLRTRFATVGYDPQDIPGLFCNYDENGDGELSMDEFRHLLEVEAKDERAHDVFQAFDNDGSGAIDDSEFIKTLFPTAYKAIYAREQQPQEEKGEDGRIGPPNSSVSGLGEYAICWSEAPSTACVGYPCSEDNSCSNGTAWLCNGAQPLGLVRKVWHNLPGKTLADLLAAAAFPDSPDLEESANALTSTANYGDNYGQMFYGLFVAPETGSYVFEITSDENSELRISDAFNDTQGQVVSYISEAQTWYQGPFLRRGYAPGPDAWDSFPTQSGSYYMEAGHLYYLEVLHKERAQSDHLIAGVQLPSGIVHRPIPASFFDAVVCTQGFPVGLAVVHDCSGRKTGQSCTAQCRGGWSGAQQTFVCDGVGILHGRDPVCTAVQCEEYNVEVGSLFMHGVWDEVDCSNMEGIKCDDQLRSWSGAENCASRVVTAGNSCRDYCLARGRGCVKSSA
ncbi:KCNA2, partial [Symbiodinium necroappetens]